MQVYDASCFKLPYYAVKVKDQGDTRLFYGEALLSIVAEPLRFFTLFVPSIPGASKEVPNNCRSYDPLVDERQYASLLEERRDLLYSTATTHEPGFDVGGFKRLLLGVILSLVGGRKRVRDIVKPLPSLEARLGLIYLRDTLGITENSRFDVLPGVRRLTIRMVWKGDTPQFYIVKEDSTIRFKVLELLYMKDNGVKKMLSNLSL